MGHVILLSIFITDYATQQNRGKSKNEEGCCTKNRVLTRESGIYFLKENWKIATNCHISKGSEGTCKHDVSASQRVIDFTKLTQELLEA
jgi:hypothetical protein